MQRLLIACALALTACATTSARADPPDSTYALRIEACVSAAADEAALAACQGVESHPCMEADGGSTHGMVMCLSEEGDAWAVLMDAALQRLASARPETAEALSASQETWNTFREAACNYRVVRWGEGSGARVELASCSASMSADRAIALILIEREGD